MAQPEYTAALPTEGTSTSARAAWGCKDHVGEWNDEAGTKVYALEMILQTLAAAGPQAVDDVEAFKRAIPELRYKNPFLKEARDLTFVGSQIFGQKRQIGVPMVVNVYRNGGFETLFVGSVAE